MNEPVDHPRFRRAERAIFTKRVVADCMSHRCRLRAEGEREKLEACCQYGVDVDVGERDAILARKDEIGALLTEAARRAPWFEERERIDPDFPSGRYVRTETFGDGCVFLAHDRRGCAIHRAALEGGWDFDGIKPDVCRLFPLSYAGDELVVSDDHPDYSCADDPGDPTIYRVARPSLEQIFGAELVAALDEAERRVEAEAATVGRAASTARRPGGLPIVG